MSKHGNYKGNLSEKDELIKRLRDIEKDIPSIKNKIDIIEFDKTVEK